MTIEELKFLQAQKNKIDKLEEKKKHIENFIARSLRNTSRLALIQVYKKQYYNRYTERYTHGNGNVIASLSEEHTKQFFQDLKDVMLSDIKLELQKNKGEFKKGLIE